MGIKRQGVQADGGKEVLMEGQEVWEEWTGSTNSGGHRVEEGSQGAMEGEGASNNVTGLEQGHGAQQGV